MTDIIAVVVADSIGEHSPRLVSIQTRAPKFIHQETLRHRRIYVADVLAMDPDFSFSVSSSRAIPFQKMLEEVRDPALRAAPIYWGAEQRGMSPGEELDDAEAVLHWPSILGRKGLHLFDDGSVPKMITKRECAKRLWDLGARLAALVSETMVEHTQIHKSTPNRMVETYVHANVLMTATEPGWMNFFGLRLDGAADPTLRALAEECWRAWCESRPTRLEHGQWHLPYIDDSDVAECKLTYVNVLVGYGDPGDNFTLRALQRISVARCARLSYLSFETGRRSTVAEDLALYDRLVGSIPIHASPAEHQSTPDRPNVFLAPERGSPPVEPIEWAFPEQAGNLGLGWRQYRRMLSGEAVAPLPEAYR